MILKLSKRQVQTLQQIFEENPDLTEVSLDIDRSSGLGTEIAVSYKDKAIELSEFN